MSGAWLLESQQETEDARDAAVGMQSWHVFGESSLISAPHWEVGATDRHHHGKF